MLSVMPSNIRMPVEVQLRLEEEGTHLAIENTSQGNGRDRWNANDR